jgi:RsiW-degrading membrane proteinase PrsW (M82 family)
MAPPSPSGSPAHSRVFVAATLWAGTETIALANSDLGIALAMDWIAYPGIVTIPVAFLLFALWYTEHESKPSLLFLLLLFVVPVLAVILVVTNDFHHLYYSDFIPVVTARGTTFWVFSRGRSTG